MNFLELKEKSFQQYEVAQHLLTVTYLLVKDSKLLPAILINLSHALELAMEALLQYELELKLISPYSQDFESKFYVFRSKSALRNKISPQVINLILDLRQIQNLQQQSAVEFRRKDRYILCSREYQLRALNPSEVKEYLQQTKQFLDQVGSIVTHFKGKE